MRDSSKWCHMFLIGENKDQQANKKEKKKEIRGVFARLSVACGFQFEKLQPVAYFYKRQT